MSTNRSFLRYASPNEQRTISRESLGLYHALIIGAVYEPVGDMVDNRPDVFFRPLRSCIDEHPYMSVIIGDMHTDKSFYKRATTIDLDEHISVLERHTDGDILPRIEEILTTNLDVPFPEDTPPWRMIVLPLQRGWFIALSYSHAIGDGLSGKAFHRTFLEAFKPSTKTEPIKRVVETPNGPLPLPFDTTERLPISWPYLLAPILSLMLPSFLSTYLGLRTSASTIDSGTWTGSSIPNLSNSDLSYSKIRLREVGALCLDGTLRTARSHDARLTGVFEESVVRALSRTLPQQDITNFVSQTAINMRKSIGVSEDEGGEYASGCYIIHPRRHASDTFSEEEWKSAASSTRKLAETASTLQDQAIGLLRYLPSMRKWTMSKSGQRRDCSFEVSNIGAFQELGLATSKEADMRLTCMVFAQPGQILNAPLAFNLVSVKGKSLIYTVGWRSGALGDVGTREETFVDTICAFIEEDLNTISG